LHNTKSTTTSYSKDCIVPCAKAGSPLGILTADGSTYLPVTTTMPDMGQDQLKPFVGEIVEAKGQGVRAQRRSRDRNQGNTQAGSILPGQVIGRSVSWPALFPHAILFCDGPAFAILPGHFVFT
jgi:hypothetical protein